MKGVFRRACTESQAARYCGAPIGDGDYAPGLLRFHGGYPTDTRWTEHLVDLVHPQQNRQIKQDDRSSAFVQISLYKPEIQVGMSSTAPLPESEWEEIWAIWGRGISMGLGCRVCAGYGQPETHTGNVLYRAQLIGQGQAAKLLDGTGEFRPNMFRATIRGHALRLFGGLTDASTADRLVDQLFGSAMDKGTVGLLGMGFRDADLQLDAFGKDAYALTTYAVKGELTWLLTQHVSEAEDQALKKLIVALTRFAMLLGGFGKSWRRADQQGSTSPSPLVLHPPGHPRKGNFVKL
ncbi:hypothetical protein BST81_18220 [Leptolyngbya sp. 'hensonii']|uniref:hypothetical protein n=1 Tax=Leptolyngbya sp. 'hensonii' TaxID=1922337 RepID=UPI00094F6F87|nr:hypothetical protein [Leptolyngbya sp. 'hensonii']OLP16926.1 hypothetical protein BST81_18220 [Leptolyngbya sp. 'hensonii']